MATNMLETYMGKVATLKTDISNYYKPLFRSGSIKPLWHIMAFTSVVMYTTTYLCLKGPKVQNGRKEQKTALAEYYKNHGISDHH